MVLEFFRTRTSNLGIGYMQTRRGLVGVVVLDVDWRKAAVFRLVEVGEVT